MIANTLDVSLCVDCLFPWCYLCIRNADAWLQAQDSLAQPATLWPGCALKEEEMRAHAVGPTMYETFSWF